jgi:predicted dehydrogenase
VPPALRVAFLGCGFITRVHSRHLRALGGEFALSYASRDRSRADDFRRQFGGQASFAGYDAAIESPNVDAVVVAVPPTFHRDLALRALAAGKHVLVEKPAFPVAGDYPPVMQAREL